MGDQQNQEWLGYLDHLFEQISPAWKPYPDHHISMDATGDVDIPQISLTNPPAHVICKITDDFATMQQYAFDEESLPPKVLCWNDVSALDIKMATKTVKAGLEHEYRALVEDLSISFQSVSFGNVDPLPIPTNREDSLLIYHVLDPTLTQKSKITPAATRPSRMRISQSTPDLGEVTPFGIQITQSPPIQDDPNGLHILKEAAAPGSVFILDCSYAHRAYQSLSTAGKNFFIFCATSQSLLYTPRLPCDLFTSCLLTPARVALLWLSQSYSDIHSGLLSEIDVQSLIDLLNDSPVASEMLNMLETALEAYVDRMAYETFKDSPDLFYRLFRSSPIISRLFTNFLFATRMMKSVSITPLSYPSLPDLSNHPLWDSFDLQVDRALYSIKESLKPQPRNIFSQAALLEEHMRRLESWLWFQDRSRPPPDELPYLVLLFASPQFFPQAISFCSKYLAISQESAKNFLSTRAFPLLPAMLTPHGDLPWFDGTPEVYADFSFVVVHCLLTSRSLLSEFEDKTSFWIEGVKSDNEQLQIASLCCLLLFVNSPGKKELYKEAGLQEIILHLSEECPESTRTLCNLLLAQMNVGLIAEAKVQDELFPLCRASLVSRISSTMDQIQIDTEDFEKFFYEIILSLNDPYPPVREEALVALSHSISCQSQEFIDALKRFFSDWTVYSGMNPLISLIGQELQILVYDPSRRINQRILEFFQYLEQLFEGEAPSPLKSELSSACIVKLSSAPNSSLSPVSFSVNSISFNATLIGSPAMSPSGFISCGDSDGSIHCNTSRETQKFDYFSTGLMVSSTPRPFRTLVADRSKAHQTVEYLSYIDDTQLLAISSRSQVVVVDTNRTDDPVTSFWMNTPDIDNRVLVDYNPRTYQVLHSSGVSLAHVFDLGSQQKITDFRLQQGRVSKIEWFHSFNTLFYGAQDDLCLYDIRMKGTVATIPNAGRDLLAINNTFAMPFYLVGGYSRGTVSIYDIRNFEMASTINLQSPLKEFDVHRQLPFSLGITDSLVSFSFEDVELKPEPQEFGVIPQSFALHQSESTCALRQNNKIQCVVIDY